MSFTARYLSDTDVTNALSQDVMVQIFDDDKDGTPDQGPIDDAKETAEGLVDSYIAANYDPSVVNTEDRFLRTAAKAYFRWAAYGRHPEYVRSRAPEQLELATSMMTAWKNGRQRAPDSQVVLDYQDADIFSDELRYSNCGRARRDF